MTGITTRIPPAARRPLVAAAAVAVVWVAAAQLLPAGLPFGIVLYGVVLGALDALTAIGLVLVYRAARVVNFAQADMGGLAAAVAVVLVTGAHVPYFAAVPLGLGAGLLTGYVMDATVVRRFFRAPRLILTVATIGVAQILGAGELGLPTLFHHLSPLSTFTTPFRGSFTVGPVVFDANDVVVFIVVPIVLVALWWFLGRSDTGVAIRAAADSDERAQLLGVPVRRLSRATWVIAAGLSSIAAVLSAPIQGPNLGVVAGPTALLVPLAAAVIAGMTSFPVAVAAAIGIDVFEQAVLWSYPRSSSVDVALFGFVLVAVLVRRKTLSRGGGDQSLGTLTTGRDRPLPAALRRWRPLVASRAALLAVVLAGAALIPVALSGPRDTILTSTVIYALVAVSMVVLLGWAGQLSLGQFAFVGIGASVTGALLVHAGADLFLALLAAAAVGGVVAVVLGLPSLRVPGLFLGVVTMAFAVPVSTWLLDSSYFPTLTPALVPRPVLLGRIDLSSPLALYEFCLVVLVLATVLARNFRRSRIGRAVLAARDNDRAAASYGVSPWRVRLVAFTFSGMLAGVAGGLYALNLRGVPFSGFNPEESIVVFTMVVVGGLGSLPGAVLGAAYVESAQYFLGGAAQLIATGAGLLVLLMVLPGGLGEVAARLRDRILRTVARRAGIDVPVLDRHGKAAVPAPSPPLTATVGSSPPGTDPLGPDLLGAIDLAGTGLARPGSGPGGTAVLTCQHVDAGYGDLQVLFDANLSVGDGDVLALLGTNGSGKSTLLKVVSGVLPATGGRVVLRGRDITTWSASRRVEAGLVMVPGGRGVFPSLTVTENLRVAGWLVRRDHGERDRRTDHVLDLFPSLRRRLHVPAGLLSGGEQQMLTLAQALMCRPSVLLIDELSLGLAPTVVSELLAVLHQLVEQGVTVVVVEQSINVAAAVAPDAVFLERGQVRFTGPTAELANRPDLARSVFLGQTAGLSPVGPSPAVSSPAVSSPAVSSNGHGPRVTPTARTLDVDEPSPAARMLAGATPSSTGEPPPGGPSFDPDEVFGPPDVLAASAAERCALEGISVQFGGVAALTDVTVRAGAGEIVGLIGANGAGKTTLFDVASGFVRPSAGRVRLLGADVTDMAPATRAQLGLGRLFQDARLFPSLTVTEVVSAAFERHAWVRDPLASTLRLGDARRSEDEIAERARSLIEELGLRDHQDAFVGELSTGTRRMVELACTLAHRPTVLLADEPSSGIAQREVEALGQLLVTIRDTTGATLLVIEHDIPMLSAVADRLVCLHLGQVIAEGTPDQVLGDDQVIAAYLGTDEVALARSG
jgi:ABC-type branched-subunit amino acid transport system ATPase component/ABC-type branched-subunit amino acid transport system permease subunit